jgi:hypothetical protein
MIYQARVFRDALQQMTLSYLKEMIRSEVEDLGHANRDVRYRTRRGYAPHNTRQPVRVHFEDSRQIANRHPVFSQEDDKFVTQWPLCSRALTQ